MLRTRSQSLFSSTMGRLLEDFWRYWHKRKVSKVSVAFGEDGVSSPQPRHSICLLSLFLLYSGLFCHHTPSPSSSLVIVFSLLSFLSVSSYFSTSSPPSALMNLTPPSHSPLFSSLSLRLPFFMSFWPRSHFPNWLSGSLIIL